MIEAYEALGWIAQPYLVGTHHGFYSCWMDWPGELGDPIEPNGTSHQIVAAPHGASDLWGKSDGGEAISPNLSRGKDEI
jgi:hypothetical protein